jgi:putrescine transport system ATP-binding protein
VQKISKSFDGQTVVETVDLEVHKGEIFALLGSSGCGKSTLLRMLAGLEIPTAGKIQIDGLDMSGIPPHLRPVNMMFQSYALFPHLSVAKNVAFGLEQEKLPQPEIKQRVAESLELVQMGKFAARRPDQLSGGQKQRIALARILAKRPKLLLLDEPMGALDKKLRERMQLEVVDILEGVGATCIMVTHDQEEAMTMATRIGIMNDGRLLQVGTPRDVYETPNCRFTAEFIGSVNLLAGTLTVDEPDHVIVTSPEFPTEIYVDHGITGVEGMPVWIALRPEKTALSTEPPEDTKYNFAQGIVHDIAYLGSHSIYHVQLATGKIVRALVQNLERWAEPPTWEDTVYLHWQPNSGVVLTQ